jgi:hypothetical protein
VIDLGEVPEPGQRARLRSTLQGVGEHAGKAGRRQGLGQLAGRPLSGLGIEGASVEVLLGLVEVFFNLLELLLALVKFLPDLLEPFVDTLSLGRLFVVSAHVVPPAEGLRRLAKGGNRLWTG